MRLRVRHGQDAMRHIAIENGRHEVRRPTLDLVRRERVARQHRGACRLGRDDLHLGTREANHLAGAGERAARAPAGDEEVEALAREVPQDFRARRVAVIRGVRFVLELSREEPAVLVRELLRPSSPCRCRARRRRENHLRAEHAHDLAALDRERLHHHGDERITLRRADRRERDAGVAGGGLDDGLAGLQRAAASPRLR